LETGKAWSYKELLRDLWAHKTEKDAKRFFGNWYNRVIRTKMEPMKKLARTLKDRIDNIVTYCTHGITNAVAEGINSKIMSIKRRAGGYRNRENFKKAWIRSLPTVIPDGPLLQTLTVDQGPVRHWNRTDISQIDLQNFDCLFPA
jgi:transposase